MSPILKSKILWKVYLSWFLKRILPLLILEVLIIFGAVYLLSKLIFVHKILDNAFIFAARNPIELVVFMVLAFMVTGWVVKISIVVFLALGVLFLRDLGRTFASYRSTSRAARRAKPN